jgi:speckle-type POZ protein
MAATGATLLSAAGRRLSRSSASTIVCREVSGHHKLTIEGFAPPLTATVPNANATSSKAFEVAGYSWRIAYQPYRTFLRGDYVSLKLAYDGWWETDPVKFKFTLLDHAGEPVPKHSRSTAGVRVVFNSQSRIHGFDDFIRWKDLEASGCLKDGRFAVRCDIAVSKDRAKTIDDDEGAAAPPAASVVVPPPNLHEHLKDLLWKKKGTTDVAIDLGGGNGEETTTYDAHGWLLAARSPVFEAELLAAAKEKVPGGVRRRVEIRGVDPKVFKAMLHFMYTDALPEKVEEEDEAEAMAMAQGLLAAADRYKLERLKLMCEEMLCNRIDMDTVAGTLAVAEKHGCRALKDACLEFLASPGNLKAFMEAGGFEKMKAHNCAATVMEFALKQLPD